MELWQAFQTIPEYWSATKLFVLGVNAALILSISLAVLAYELYQKKKLDVPAHLAFPGFIAILLIALSTLAWMAVSSGYDKDHPDIAAGHVAEYVQAKEGITATSPVVLSTQGGEVLTYLNFELDRMQKAQFTGVNSDGEMVDVLVTWPQVQDAPAGFSYDNPVKVTIYDAGTSPKDKE